jgi:multidrug resistance efflux pump
MKNSSRHLSEEILEILNETPGWVVRCGTMVFLFIIALFLAGAWIIRYPEILRGEAVVTTEAPPIKVVSEAGGRVTRLVARDEVFVKKGDILAETESTIRLESIPVLQSLIRESRSFLTNHTGKINLPADSLTWGELQEDVNRLRHHYQEYQLLQSDDYHRLQAKNLREQIAELNRMVQVNERQRALHAQELRNVEDSYKTDEKLYAEQIYSKQEFQKKANTYLEKRTEAEDFNKEIIKNKLKLAEVEKELQYLAHNLQEKKRACLAGIGQHLQNIENGLKNWQKRYLITAPADGKLVYLKQLTENQYVRPADTLFAVIPAQQQYVALVDIPVRGMGKAGVGQKVILKMDDYPFQEFGTLEGRVLNMAPSLSVKSYRVIVELPEGLRSSHAHHFQCRAELSGSAEIITEDMRLLERVFYSFRKLLA